MYDTDLKTQHNSFTNSVRPFPCIYVCFISRALLENIYENITYTFINPVICKKRQYVWKIYCLVYLCF